MIENPNSELDPQDGISFHAHMTPAEHAEACNYYDELQEKIDREVEARLSSDRIPKRIRKAFRRMKWHPSTMEKAGKWERMQALLAQMRASGSPQEIEALTTMGTMLRAQ